MPHRIRTLFRSVAAVALVAVLGVGLVTAVLAAVEGQAEQTDPGNTWPHEVKYPEGTEPYSGKSAAWLLKAIHDKAVIAFDTEADPAKKAQIQTVLKHCLDCLAFDGGFADPNKDHHASGAVPAHTPAKAKLLQAYMAAHPPMGPVDWGPVGSGLGHGH